MADPDLILCHVVAAAAWGAMDPSAAYPTGKLAADEFLHCCQIKQLDFVLARDFSGFNVSLVDRFRNC